MKSPFASHSTLCLAKASLVCTGALSMTTQVGLVRVLPNSLKQAMMTSELMVPSNTKDVRGCWGLRNPRTLRRLLLATGHFNILTHRLPGIGHTWGQRKPCRIKKIQLHLALGVAEVQR